ncbi:MAG: hypothetical protein KBG84_16950 [Planctomycetes bacterium]|nr:hypothetical protein [Planctomycetota bacterium]
MIRSVVLALSLVIWSIIGFFVWVPLLLRATVHMAGAVLYSTLLRKDTNRAAARLNHAMEFLPGGFARIFRAVNTGGAPDLAEDDSDPGLFEGLRAFLRIVFELVIALAFWFLLGALFRFWALPEFDRALTLFAQLYETLRRVFGL